MMNLTPRLNRIENNLIIDGGMEIWPEGTSRSVANNSAAYGSVLMKAANTSTGVTLTNSRQLNIPSNTNLTYSNQISKTAAGVLAAGTISALQYTIEGYDLSRMITKESSLIFWVKSSVVSNRGLSIQNGNASHAFVQQYAINQANTWELKVIKLPALNTCPGTLERTNGAGATVIFSIVSGSTFQTSTLNSWVAGPKFCGIGEDTTWLTGTSHDFSVAGVMVLPGDWTELTSVTYEFVRAGKDFQNELDKTKRFFEKSYQLDIAPGSIDGPYNTTRWYQSVGVAIRMGVDFEVEKRTTPTFSTYSGIVASGSSDRVNISGVEAFRNAFAANTKGAWVENSSVNPTGAITYGFMWTADARF